MSRSNSLIPPVSSFPPALCPRQRGSLEGTDPDSETMVRDRSHAEISPPRDPFRPQGSVPMPYFKCSNVQNVRNARMIDGLHGADIQDFTTECSETRFAGRGRQFEKFAFGFDTGNPSAFHGFRARGRWVCEAKTSNRLPCPAEPVSAPSVV